MKLAPFFAFFAIFLQIAVYLQPVLPERFQIALVCETIVDALAQDHSSHAHHVADLVHDTQKVQSSDMHQHHSADHQCLYCKVHGHLIAFLDFEIKEVFERIQIRLLAFQHAFRHVYFTLQQLFLLPQGRAPPLFIV